MQLGTGLGIQVPSLYNHIDGVAGLRPRERDGAKARLRKAP